MIRLLADENISRYILDGLRRRWPEIDIEWVQDVGLRGVDDRVLLQYAAEQERVILTHDADTMIGFAYERSAAGLSFPGLIIISAGLRFGSVIEDLGLLCFCSRDDELQGQVIHLPLR